MHIQPSIQVECPSCQEAYRPFVELQTGDVISVRLAALDGLTAVLETREGKPVQVALPPGVRLLEGDELQLALSGRQNGRIFLRLLSVNGQTVLMEPNHLKDNLTRLGIAPTARNIRLALAFRQNGYIPEPETIEGLNKILLKAPGLPLSVAAFMAAHSLMPNERESRLFARPGQIPGQFHPDSGTDNFTYLQLPVRFEDRSNTAELFIFRGGRGRSKIKKDQSVVLIALETKNMDRVEATLRTSPHGLDIGLSLQSQSVQKHFEKNLRLLKDALVRSGLSLAGIRAALAGGSPAQSDPSGQSPRHPGSLDIQV